MQRPSSEREWISRVIDELCDHSLLKKPVRSRVLVGGTHAPVTLLEDDERLIVIKSESPAENRLIAGYLTRYRTLDLLPDLLVLAEDASYLAYTYLVGDPIGDRDLDRDHWHSVIDRVIARSEPSNHHGWGSPLEPQATLTAFLMQQFADRCAGMDNLLGPGASVEITELIHAHGPVLTRNVPYRLHGDCGAHNLLLRDQRIVGLIDPLVVDSLPVLEALFLVASTPHRLGLDAVVELCARLPAPLLPPEPVIRDLYRMTLFNRIDTCRRRHPKDLERYLQMYREL